MILITGCTGYIGRYLATALLKKKEAVRGLVLPKEQHQAVDLLQLGMETWLGDLLVPETLKGIGENVTTIYHLAGIHSASIQRMEDVYVQGSINLVHACRANTIDSCIVASNGAAYGDQGDTFLTEDSLPIIQHPFSRITIAMERVFLDAFQSYGFPCHILRIAEVYGSGNISFVSYLQARPTKLLGTGNNWTSHISIYDVGAIMLEAPICFQPGEIYNIVDDLPVRQKELYSHLATLTSLPLPEWIPLHDVPERIRTSIHGLRALSLRMGNAKLKAAFHHSLQFPTYVQGFHETLKQILIQREVN